MWYSNSNNIIMKLLFKYLFFVFVVSCNPKNVNSDRQELLARLDKVQFDTLHDWNLGEALLKDVSIAKNEDEESKMLRNFSPGQKALYLFWDLNDEVTNGGFIQYYWNGYEKYVPDLKAGLKLVGDTTILSLLVKADSSYKTNKDKFDEQIMKDDWEPLYESLKEFDLLDSIYYEKQQDAMILFEKYIRKHPNQFVQIN